VSPAALGLDTEAGELRAAVQAALAAENVRVSRWQNVPVPAQPLFQKKNAYGRGCPWSGQPGAGTSYDLSQYPRAFQAIEESLCLWGLVPPNDFDLMDAYADAFEKVFGNIPKVLQAHRVRESYVPLAQRIQKLASRSSS
jgi:perosamine synthetase